MPPRCDTSQRFPQSARAADLDDLVDSLLPREFPDLAIPVGIGQVVDGMDRTQRSTALQFRVAFTDDIHRAAHRDRELQGEDRDSSGPQHQNRVG